MYSSADKELFRSEVRQNFHFLETDGDMCCGNVLVWGGDYPDARMVVRYSRADLKVDVIWSLHERSLWITIRFDRPDIPDEERRVDFESFVEYITDSADKAVVPYSGERQTVKQIKKILLDREKLFEKGRIPVIEALGDKLMKYFHRISASSSMVIHSYHEWRA